MTAQTATEAGADELFDVVIIGAGLSGIGAACHLRRDCPDRSLVLLEARECSGGTWDLFRYPGIRSDSDMHTLGYDFKPWQEAEAIADAPAILRYVRDTAREYGVDEHIRYQHRVLQANWDSGEQCWTLEVACGPGEATLTIRARYILNCGGYYSYARGHQPEFPGRADYAGTFVHPQFWPEKLDYRGKRVVVIGSGATAMTLVPTMAKEAASVTLLQRSPSYVIARPTRDALANLLRKLLPDELAYRLVRWKNVWMQNWFYRRTRKAPERVRRMLLKQVQRELGDAGDMADFSPAYQPWDQRLCLLPDGDLFSALKSGVARMKTAEIESLNRSGVRLKSGEQLDADIIVSATGLELEIMGGVQFAVDGEPFNFASSWSYRGMMCSGLPNVIAIFGYINASWTLRADIVARWFCRLLEHMRENDLGAVMPRLSEAERNMPGKPYINGFSAAYMQRAMHRFPRQGDREPWVNSQDYLREREEFAEMDFSEPALRYEALSPQREERIAS